MLLQQQLQKFRTASIAIRKFAGVLAGRLTTGGSSEQFISKKHHVTSLDVCTMETIALETVRRHGKSLLVAVLSIPGKIQQLMRSL